MQTPLQPTCWAFFIGPLSCFIHLLSRLPTCCLLTTSTIFLNRQPCTYCHYSLLHFLTLFQWWGEWSTWSSCSRSCGGGVRSQERHCLIQSSYCDGSSKQYQLCPNQSCPNPSISFKQHQCSQFNSKQSFFHLISNKPCDLQCTTISGERQLLVPAHDGTFCHDTKYHGVCIEGICQPVGCDGELYSSKAVDRCGVCGGNGTSCQRISGSYRKAFTQLGYMFITNIPAGAKDIQIIERHKTENILALSDEAGHFFFNGNTVFDNPQNFHVAGTVVKYRRPSSMFSDGLEYIIAQGPIQQDLNVMVYYNLNGKLPHITYEYTIPLKSYDKTALEGINKSHTHPHLNVTYNKVNGNARVDQVRLTNHSRWNMTSVHCYNTQLGTNEQSDVQTEEEEEEEVVWKIRTPSPPPPVAMLVYRLAEVTSHVFSHNDWDFSNKLEKDLISNYLSVSAPPSNDFDVGLDPDISLADMYRWKVSAYAPCSSTCTTGITTSYALCVRYDGAEVDDTYCDSLTRPEPTHELCTGKECPPRWETSGWSECSRTCGEGVQYRTVRCWKMLSPGLDSSVYDSLCLSHDLHKPATRKVCLGQSCGPQWEVAEWSECLARCGSRGVRTREVRCSMAMRLCNKSSQPIESQECEGPPCDRRWTVSDWGPCSGVCGEGRMVRAVMCRSSSGEVMSEEQCAQSLRPLAIYPCGDRECAPHWVEQEWQQCNTTCGRGVRHRWVVCAGLEGGVFKEFPDSSCDQTNKPETSSSCFQRPLRYQVWLFKYSQNDCKTCGNGVQVREVKCYQGQELVTRGHSCDSALKPKARQSCEIQSCPKETPAMDDSCQDKPTANCALVLKVKLCSHWYYRKACCQSCKAPRP
uniref:PLAC domain-containing protein n=1 Tax=Monopterus albus TaxID=43700 RepID=A0A3Q3IKL8_MONAL